MDHLLSLLLISGLVSTGKTFVIYRLNVLQRHAIV